jgi:ABC-2 type transport system ATP-binding protein
MSTTPQATGTGGFLAQGLTRSYRGTRALDGVDLVSGVGLLGVLGPNGAGKTTLLRILATVAAPDSGTLTLLGRDVADTRQRLAVRRRLGYVPQEPGFPRGFTAYEYVDYIALLKEMADRRHRAAEVLRVLDAVGLSDRAGTKVRKLSGGMRRRLALAQALLGDPALLILDEPTTGLDPEQRVVVRDLMSTLAESRCVVLSTHLAEDVAALAHRVAVLHEGRVRYDGPPRGLTEVASGRVWLGAERDPGARLAWRGEDGTVRQVGDPPQGAALAPPTMEDGYLLLVDAGSTP